MIISHKYNFIYIAVNKTASTSTEAFLEAVTMGNPLQKISHRRKDEKGVIAGRSGHAKNMVLKHHMSISEALEKFPDCKDYYKICNIRNPYEKFVSNFFFRTKLKQIDKKTISDFKKYVNSFYQNRKKFSWNSWDKMTIDGKFVMDFVIRFENLFDDIENLLNFLGVKNFDMSKFPKFNSSNMNDSWRSFYDEPTKQKVHEMCKDTIEMFNYSLE